MECGVPVDLEEWEKEAMDRHADSSCNHLYERGLILMKGVPVRYLRCETCHTRWMKWVATRQDA